jgi:hypothetical protein
MFYAFKLLLRSRLLIVTLVMLTFRNIGLLVRRIGHLLVLEEILKVPMLFVLANLVDELFRRNLAFGLVQTCLGFQSLVIIIKTRYFISFFQRYQYF